MKDPLPGETLTADAFATSPGGKGANQAVACAKLSRARPTPGVEPGATANVAMVGWYVYFIFFFSFSFWLGVSLWV